MSAGAVEGPGVILVSVGQVLGQFTTGASSPAAVARAIGVPGISRSQVISSPVRVQNGVCRYLYFLPCQTNQRSHQYRGGNRDALRGQTDSAVRLPDVVDVYAVNCTVRHNDAEAGGDDQTAVAELGLVHDLADVVDVGADIGAVFSPPDED